jgi:sec-independent protein translocase protein TatB
MFDIGFPELVLIAIVGLLVIGPERLPEALRTLGLWIGRMRRSFSAVKDEIEKEIGMDEIRRQLHNEAVMDELKRIERDVKSTIHAPDGSVPEDRSPPAVDAAADAAAEPGEQQGSRPADRSQNG